MANQKLYLCSGFTSKGYNEHLRGIVGDSKTLDEWVAFCYPSASETTRKKFFNDTTDKMKTDYLYECMGIRLTRI